MTPRWGSTLLLVCLVALAAGVAAERDRKGLTTTTVTRNDDGSVTYESHTVDSSAGAPFLLGAGDHDARAAAAAAPDSGVLGDVLQAFEGAVKDFLKDADDEERADGGASSWAAAAGDDGEELDDGDATSFADIEREVDEAFKAAAPVALSAAAGAVESARAAVAASGIGEWAAGTLAAAKQEGAALLDALHAQEQKLAADALRARIEALAAAANSAPALAGGVPLLVHGAPLSAPARAGGVVVFEVTPMADALEAREPAAEADAGDDAADDETSAAADAADWWWSDEAWAGFGDDSDGLADCAAQLLFVALAAGVAAAAIAAVRAGRAMRAAAEGAAAPPRGYAGLARDDSLDLEGLEGVVLLDGDDEADLQKGAAAAALKGAAAGQPRVLVVVNRSGEDAASAAAYYRNALFQGGSPAKD